MNQYQITKLRRLIHCMTKQNHDSTATTICMANEEKEKKIAMEQITLARMMLNELRELFVVGQQLAAEDRHHHQFHPQKRDEQVILQKLEISVEEACKNLSEKYSIGISSSNSSSDGNVNNGSDLVDEIFFKDDDDDDEELSFDESNGGNNNHNLSNDDDDEYHLSFSDDDAHDENDEHDNRQNHHQHHHRHQQQNGPSQSKSIPQEKKKLTTEELQKQQEEQLQNEISEMAEQLKHATMNINKTLASGNNDLDNLASLAQSNFDRVKNANEEVTKHVKASGWRKSVGRWVVFFCVLSTWILCFLTIRVVPKRKGTCLFLCKEESTKRNKSNRNKRNNERPRSNNHHYYDDYYEDDDDDDYDYGNKSSSSSTKSSEKKVHPKYSYCQKNNDNGNDCTVPDNLEGYEHKIHNIDLRGDSQSQNFAHDIAAEMKEKRYLENLKKAEREEESIGLNRVREGWHKNDDDTNADDTNADDKFEDSKTTYTYQDAVRAAWHDAPTLVTILLEDPDLVDYADENGWTVLHEASRQGNMDSVVAILRHLDDENDVNIKTNVGTTAMWLAKQHKHDEIVEILAAHGGVELPSRDEKEENEYDEDFDDDYYEDDEYDEMTAEPQNNIEEEKEENEYDEDFDDDFYEDDEYDETTAEPQNKIEEEREEKDADKYYDDDDYDEHNESNEHDQRDHSDETTAEHPDFSYEDAVYTAIQKESSFLSTILSRNPELVRFADENGWTLLHEAVRGGNIKSVSIILDFLDDVSYLDRRTKGGGNAIWLAKTFNFDSIVELLEARGGVELPPEDITRKSEL